MAEENDEKACGADGCNIVPAGSDGRDNAGLGERVWLKKVKPRLEEIVKLRANGATMQQIAEVLGVGGTVLSELKSSEPELAAAFARAHNRSKEILEGDVWKLARGEVVSVEETEIRGKDGELKGSQKKVVHPVPSLPALLAFLKQCYGWSDNPVVDNALAGAMERGKMRAYIYQVLNIPDTGEKSSPRSGGGLPLSCGADEDSAGGKER